MFKWVYINIFSTFLIYYMAWVCFFLNSNHLKTENSFCRADQVCFIDISSLGLIFELNQKLAWYCFSIGAIRHWSVGSKKFFFHVYSNWNIFFPVDCLLRSPPNTLIKNVNWSFDFTAWKGTICRASFWSKGSFP